MENIALKNKIYESGYRLKWIAKKMGITPFSLTKKLKGETEFKASEIGKLCILMGIPSEDISKYFFLN